MIFNTEEQNNKTDVYKVEPRQPQSYAEMFQQAYGELQRRTDIYFKLKQKELDKYIEDKIKEILGNES